MEELARTYSKALFGAAKDQDKIDEVREQLGSFADSLSGNRELSFFFFSPYFSSREKKDGLKKLLQGPEPIFFNFLQVLLDKHRMPVIFRIRKDFEALWAEENRLLNVEVVSAIELDKSTLTGIRKSVEAQSGRKVELTDRVDDDIIGGVVLQVGNLIFDASIRNQLERLRRQVAVA